MLCLGLTFTACEEENGFSGDEISNTLIEAGDWKVSLYEDDDDGDETSRFNGYRFTFSESGNLFVARGDETRTGSWHVTPNGEKLVLDLDNGGLLNQTPELDDIDDTWIITSKTSDLIKLREDDDDGDNDDDRLYLGAL